MSAPEWMLKHPCASCGTGYGACAQGLTMSLACCKNCEHPGRWAEDAYTVEDIEAMWEGKDMPPHVQRKLRAMRDLSDAGGRVEP